LEDNQSAIAYSQNALVSEKTKHIGLKWHFLKDHVEQGTIKLRYLPTNQMVADMFTKPLLAHALTRHRSAILGGQDPLKRFIP
jgi:KUP system potassium uptake protein